MKERIAKIFMCFLAVLICFGAVKIFMEKAYVVSIICILVAFICLPFVQNKLFKKKDDYYSEIKIILLSVGAMLCLIIIKNLVGMMSRCGMEQGIIVERMEGYLKLLVYIVYLAIIFMCRNKKRRNNYIIFGVLYVVCVALSYTPSCDKEIIISIINRLEQAQTLDMKSFNLMIDAILIPIREAALTYIIFDTVMDEKEHWIKQENEDRTEDNCTVNDRSRKQKEGKFNVLVKDIEKGKEINYMIKVKDKN